ncbi:3-methyl-2-oxobutanoate hydroxymethyltransferase [Sporobolomyces salmoneus]|uniref:3-methyl-2-oxobutanoate hydroxymethyltransferase n=1 Tax=Sporobolomyces salmoneus TaxID=183962 RepID=UPI003178E480
MSTGSVARPILSALRGSSASLSSSVPFASTSTFRFTPLSGPQILHRTGCKCGSVNGQTRSYSSYPSEKPSPLSSSVSAAQGPPPVPRKKRTVLDLQSFKRKKIPITMLTAHDYPSARYIEAASLPSSSPSSSSSSSSTGATTTTKRGIDICLVGDSLAMVACGYSSTTSLSLDELLYHCRSVARGCHTSLLIADLPFGTYHASISDGVKAAIRLIQEGNMDGVKIEGGEEIVPLVEHLTRMGIPVMGHIGLTPQRASSLGGFRVQGKTSAGALKVLKDARALDRAGVFSMVLEAVPSEIAEHVSERIQAPTIGIGAGNRTDGQVLVQLDMLGGDPSPSHIGPKFVKKFGNVGEEAVRGIREYVDEVRGRSYPEEGQHTYPMKKEEFDGFLRAVEAEEEAEQR